MARRIAKAPPLPIPDELAQPVAPQEQIAMQSPSGEQMQIPAEQAATFAGLGYRQITPELTAQQAEEAKYGEGIVNELEAAGLGILRGSSLGLSDLALRKINPQWADSAAKLKQYNPDASLAGEIGSFFIPGALGLLGKTGKAAGAGAGLLQNLVSSSGAGLGKIATKIVGDNLAGHALGAGINMAAQSAVYQAAHNISEDALGDKDLTAESILANTGQAAILGAGIGIALPVAARAAQAVAESAPVRYAVSGAAKQFAKFFDPDRSLQLYSGAMGNGKLLRDTLEGNKFKDSVSLAREAGFYGPGEVAFDPAKEAFTQVAKGGMPTGREAFDRLLTGKKSIYNRTQEILGEADARIAASPALQETLSRFPEKAREAIQSKIDDIAANQLGVDRAPLQALLDEAMTKFGAKNGSLAGLNEFKKNIYEGINYKVEGNAAIQIKKDIARAVKSAVEAGAETALPGAGTSIKKLNGLYGALETIREPLDILLQKGEANVNVFGLRFRDMMTGIGGGFAGGAVGGPLWAAAGLGLGAANKLLQTDTGLLARAAIGEKIQKLAWAEQLMNKSQAEIASSIKSFLSQKSASKLANEGVAKFGAPIAYSLSSSATPEKRASSQQDWFEETRKQILAVASDPETFAALQGQQAQPLADAAPGVTDALIGKQLQIYAYLANVMPKNPGMPTNIFKDGWKPADYEVQKFRKIVRTVRAPLTILDDLHKGTISADQVAAIRTLYPKLYESILDRVRQEVSAPDVQTVYQQRLKLGLLFPGTEQTTAADFIAAMQTPASKPDEPKNTVRPPGGQVKLSKNMQTSTERVATR